MDLVILSIFMKGFLRSDHVFLKKVIDMEYLRYSWLWQLGKLIGKVVY